MRTTLALDDDLLAKALTGVSEKLPRSAKPFERMLHKSVVLPASDIGSQLQITGVGNFRHGTGYLGANGFVHFNPEANYAGTGAGFEYAMAAVNEGRFLWVA